MGQNFLIKPGALLLILVIGGLLFGMTQWAESTFTESGNRSLEQQQQAIDCSALSVRFIDRKSNQTHETVFLQVDRPVEALSVTFYGEDNTTKVIRDIGPNSVVTASAGISGLKEIEAQAKNCPRVFG